MAIEIVDFPIKNGDFPVRYVKLPEGTTIKSFKSFKNSAGSWNPSRATHPTGCPSTVSGFAECWTACCFRRICLDSEATHPKVFEAGAHCGHKPRRNRLTPVSKIISWCVVFNLVLLAEFPNLMPNQTWLDSAPNRPTWPEWHNVVGGVSQCARQPPGFMDATRKCFQWPARMPQDGQALFWLLANTQTVRPKIKTQEGCSYVCIYIYTYSIYIYTYVYILYVLDYKNIIYNK